MNNNFYIAILAGGVGSRFWPASRESRPKQFLDMLGMGKSLLQMTYDRVKDLVPENNIYCVTNKEYISLVNDNLTGMPANRIIGEPSRNNTAPSVLYTALQISRVNPDAVIGFVPSDHLILNEEEYIRLCNEAFNFAQNNQAIVTLGITPTRADTGYGYIHFDKNDSGDIKKVISFKEKPDVKAAHYFLETHEYLWNAGMFFMSVRTLLDSFRTLKPDMYHILGQSLHLDDSQQTNFLEEHYHQTENISIDYAIIEKSPNVYTIPADIGWSDLGTWASLHQEMGKDGSGNAVLSPHVLLENVHHSIIKNNTEKLVILRDVNDLIVIVEEDVVMVYPMNKEQDIRELRDRIKESHISVL